MPKSPLWAEIFAGRNLQVFRFGSSLFSWMQSVFVFSVRIYYDRWDQYKAFFSEGNFLGFFFQGDIFQRMGVALLVGVT